MRVALFVGSIVLINSVSFAQQPPNCPYGLEPGSGPMRCANPKDPNSFLGGSVERLDTGSPCVPQNRYTQTDSLIFHTGLREDTFKGSFWESFNCFYYVMTWILGELPPPPMLNSAEQVQKAQMNSVEEIYYLTNHLVPGFAYMDNNWLTQHGYKRVFVTTSLAAGPVGTPGNPYQLQGFRPNDIIMVPEFSAYNTPYSHASVVTKTDGNGHVVMTRQKVDPRTCVQDLTSADFDRVYGSQGIIFEVWRWQSNPPVSRSCPPGMVAVPMGDFLWCRMPGAADMPGPPIARH